ncbi:DivIVA domain-containing protein [Micromonospora sp. WMMD882]|uniref:DivIVA domain-containing protein n=1 Tax=Micromonospora sp. WMMD882 TaxID=3015151 RepID=UPI00248B8E1F|nr:DivIVA domain-containing protein [Micromonospora sp. WMMD882]WBB78973.1 DivIVA domain-containing protein [Micromonospora sp. WMMD882]
MRRLLGWLVDGHRSARHRQVDAAPYRSRYCLPLLPAQIRDRRFRLTRLGRRGLDPDDVRRFLDRVALELADAHAAADRATRETVRIKEALRRWQSEQARTRDGYALRR